MPPRPAGRMLDTDRPRQNDRRGRDGLGCAIIEEWTAWFLVRERERELARRLRIKDAERSRAAVWDDNVTALPARVKTARTTPPPGNRKAA
jgi:hypothetical protein